MKFLALLTMSAGSDRAAFPSLLVVEEQVIWASYRVGLLREKYFQRDPLAVSLIYETGSIDEVHTELDKLPMVQAGLLDRQIVSLGPWLPLEVMFDKSLMGET